MLKIIFTSLQLIVLLLNSEIRAEEASILTSAVLVGSEIDSGFCPDRTVLMKGYFKTYCETSYNIIDNDNEMVIDL